MTVRVLFIIVVVLVAIIVWLIVRLSQMRSTARELTALITQALPAQKDAARLPLFRGQMGWLTLRVNGIVRALREAQEELLQEQGKFAGIFRYIQSGVILIDRSGRVLLTNDATERLLGLTKEEIAGRWHWEAGHHYGLSSLVDEAIEFGTVQKREVQIRKPQERTLEAHVTPIRHSSGALAGAVILLHDISEWRRVERMRSDFVANVSHELRTPITALKGFTETLLDGALDDPGTARHFVQIMKDEADRLGRLVEDLLDLSRIEAQHTALHFSAVPVQGVLDRVIQTCHARAQEAGVALTCESDVSKLYVMADADRLQQVLLNLVDNALQHTPAGGRIVLQVTTAIDRAILSVADTGCGIPASDVGRVFERFYRVDKTRSRQSGGTGLGLAIVKHIVEAHGGHVGVTSDVGAGSRFFFDLPMVDVDANLNSASETLQNEM